MVYTYKILGDFAVLTDRRKTDGRTEKDEHFLFAFGSETVGTLSVGGVEKALEKGQAAFLPEECGEGYLRPILYLGRKTVYCEPLYHDGETLVPMGPDSACLRDLQIRLAETEKRLDVAEKNLILLRCQTQGTALL